MQLVLEAYGTLFRVWELAVSFLGLLPLTYVQRQNTNRRRTVQWRTIWIADARCDVVAASAVLLGAVSSARAADQWFVMGQRTLNATDPSAEIKTEGARFKKDVKQVRLAVEGADVQMIKVVLGCSLKLCSFQLHGFVAFR